MATPNSILHIPRPLEDYVLAYRPDLAGYLWSTALPKKVVRHKSDQIRQESKGNLLRKLDLKIGANGRITEHQFKMDSTLSFACEDFGVEVFLSYDERANADSELQYDQRQMDAALISMQTNMEWIIVKEMLRNAANWGANVLTLAGGDQWEKHNSPQSDPVADLLTICDQIEQSTAHRPNFIGLNRLVWRQIQTHPNVLARGPVHTSPSGLAIVTPEDFEKILEVPPGSLHITAATVNIALEDQPADFRSFTGPDVVVAYNEPGTMNSFGMGQTFFWTGSDAIPQGMEHLQPAGEISVLSYPRWDLGRFGADVVKVSTSFQAKIMNSQSGFLIVDAVDKTNTGLFGNFLNN